MSFLKSAAVLAATFFGAVSACLAGTSNAFDFSLAPGATTTVAPISPEVTYSKPTEVLKTFVAFNVGSGAYLLKNVGGNTLNHITITFTATVTDGAETLKLFDPATYLAGLPAGCTYPTGAANPLTITCTASQYRVGDSFPAFTVFYEAPAKVTQISPAPPVGDDPLTDFVKLDIRVVYAEGTSGGNPRPNSVVDITDGGAVSLGTDNPTLVKSAVPKAGSTLFTGVGAVATAADPWTTTVIVPADFAAPTGNYTIATIEEASTPTGTGTIDCPLASNLTNCSSTTLTIPGSFAKLIIFLRRDASTLVFPNRPGDIDSAEVFYHRDPDSPSPDPLVTYPLKLLSCTDTTYGPLPRVGIPCIKARTRYPNSAPIEWRRDWEFEIWALDNGQYEN